METITTITIYSTNGKTTALVPRAEADHFQGTAARLPSTLWTSRHDGPNRLNTWTNTATGEPVYRLDGEPIITMIKASTILGI